MNRSLTKAIIFSALWLFTLSACSTSPSPRLYIIEPMAGSTHSENSEGLTVTVGPIDLPGHLDHKGIVTHDQRYRINSAEFDRWAEPLDDNIARVMCENLSILIPSNQVIAYPPHMAVDVDYSVRIRIIEFGSNPDGQVVLNAAWMVHDSADNPVDVASTRFSAPRRGDDVVTLVETMSLAIEQLSRDIAQGLLASDARVFAEETGH